MRDLHSSLTARTRLTIGIGALVCASAMAGDVRAQGSNELNEASRAVFKEAVQAAGTKDWAVCRTKAAGVWDQVKNPTVAALLGACEEELGMHRDAAEHLDFFLQRDSGKEPVQTNVAKEAYAKARKHVVLVTVNSVPGEAEVWMGNAMVTRTPARLFVEPGASSVELRKSGYANATQSWTASAGDERSFAVSLEEQGGGGGAGAGGAGGGGAGGAGGEGGGEPDSKPIWPAILMGGVGAVGLGVGISLTVASAGKYDDAETMGACADQTCINAQTDLLGESDTFQNAAIAGYAIGGAALIGMTVYLLIPGPEPANAAVQVVPIATPDTQGVIVTGTF
ncbi:MAG: PEGA domain-containing protein [Polyangiaceae bacterium]|nr:PEGA domain-containing protein [Polyangiaceae bacterium]